MGQDRREEVSNPPRSGGFVPYVTACNTTGTLRSPGQAVVVGKTKCGMTYMESGDELAGEDGIDSTLMQDGVCNVIGGGCGDDAIE